MIATTTTTMLRSGVIARSCTLQPFFLVRNTAATTCAYSTLKGPSPFSLGPRLPTPTTTTTKPASAILTLRAQTPQPQPGPSGRRHASSSSSSSPTSRDQQEDAAAAARAARRAETAAASTNPDMPPLDWNTFFALRKTRRRWQLGFSVVMSLASGTSGALVLSTGVADGLTSQVPLDPILTLGVATIGFVALGWLIGPILGNSVFYLLNRQFKTPMTVKESQFFARIKKNRVDPSNASTGNPVPDFYGEKISSVAGYRQWLKDQRAYNKKRTTYI